MRRRWLLILGGVVALGVATVLTLALITPRGPFRFLDGHKPVSSSPPKWRSPGVWWPETDTYSFHDDSNAMLTTAMRELLSHGYDYTVTTDEHGQPWGHFFDQPPSNRVVLIPDHRTVPNTYEFAPHWIVIEVSVDGNPATMWDRIKAMFGL